MANYKSLKTTINANVKRNGNQEITGQILNSVMNAMVNSLGAGYQYIGVATTSTNPGTPDQNVFYLASTAGTYINFGGVVLSDGEVAFLKYNGTWTKEIVGLAKADWDSVFSLAKVSYGVKYEPSIGSANASGTHRDVSNATAVFISSYVDNPGRNMLVFLDSSNNVIKTYYQHNGILNEKTGCYELFVPVPSGASSCVGGKYQIGDIDPNECYLKILTADALNAWIAEIASLKAFTDAGGGYRFVDVKSVVAANGRDTAILFNKAIKAMYLNCDDTIDKSDITGFIILNAYSGTRYEVRVLFSHSSSIIFDNLDGSLDKTLVQKRETSHITGYFVIDWSVLPSGQSIFANTPPLDHVFEETSYPQIYAYVAKEKSSGVESVMEKTDLLSLIPIPSSNLVNPDLFALDQSYYISDLIPVNELTDYTTLNNLVTSNYYFRFVYFYNSNREQISSIDVGKTFTTPANTAYIVIWLYKTLNNVSLPITSYGLFEGTTPVWENYHGNSLGVGTSIDLSQKKDGSIVNRKDLVGNVISMDYAFPKAKIFSGNNFLEVAIDYNQARIEDVGVTANPHFNFYSFLFNGDSQNDNFKDDIAPSHFLGTTLGANHGQPAYKATISNHGLTNVDVGTAWNKGGVTFYVVSIVDADNVVFLSANSGTESSPSWTTLTTGSISRNGATLTISAIASVQVPCSKNEQIKVLVNGEHEVEQDGTYSAKFIDFVESYDIINPSSMLDYLIAHAGSENPVYDGNVAVHFELIYRVMENLTTLVFHNFIPKQNILFKDIMPSQAMLQGVNGTTKYYVPNSLPMGNDLVDLRSPLAVNWSNLVDSLYATEAVTKDANHPINRVIMFATNHGFAIGFNLEVGTGQNLFDFTSNTFELRRGTGKIYPHSVNGNKVGTQLVAGQMYTALMYRAFFIPEASGNRLSMYHYEFDGAEYVYLDYKGSIIDHVVIDDILNGGKISVVESQNATLKTDVYNGGFYVNASFVQGETCYMVVKITK